MVTLRKDYLLDEWVIISESRGKRPHDFKPTIIEKPKIDFFAPGNENLTPAEIGRYPKKGKWQLRWFPNKFGAVGNDAFKAISGDALHASQPAFGYHEIIAETSSSTKQLWDFPLKHLQTLFGIYQERILELSKKKHIKYIQIFKNNGKEAGASLIHSHSQVVALPMVPQTIVQKKNAIKETGITYQSILQKELKTERKAFETKHFGAICPYASKFNYEVLIIPKKKYSSLAQMPRPVLNDFAAILYKILQKAKKGQWPYNYYLEYDPNGQMSLHLTFAPRLANWAGFEFSTSMVINSVCPEDAAAFYRKK